MITLLSPAKSLDFETPLLPTKCSEILFADKAAYLAAKLSKLSPKKLRTLMDISDELAQLNATRFGNWSLPIDNTRGRQAIFAFKGDVYQGLQAEHFTDKELDDAQQSLRILSGLHGVLRPLDLILPYRLEMGTSWSVTPKTKSLYAFWKKTVTAQLMDDLKASGSNLVLNLASQEYAKVVDFKSMGAQVISPEFKEERQGKFQMISFFAKKARGLMAAHVIKSGIDDFSGLKNFDAEGYALNERLSDLDKHKWVFTRKSKQ